MRILDFTDGFSSNSAPSQGSVAQNAYATYASDAAFAIGKGSAAAEGDVYFNTVTNQVRVHDGVQFNDEVGIINTTVGINHILNSSGDSTAGYATFKDAAGVIPEDGTGGAPVVTFTSSAASPLRGDFSFLLTKGAVNAQGEGVSYAFTIPPADNNKRLYLSFDYAASGGFVAGSNSDVGVWIYDVTNATLITPSNVSLLAGSGQYEATYLSTNSSSYRLILFTRTVNAVAWTLKFDNVVSSPQYFAVGSSPISDWVSFTPTSTWVTNVVHTGFYRRVGSDLEIRIFTTCTGLVSVANLAYDLPPGFTTDPLKNINLVCGTASFVDATVATYIGSVRNLLGGLNIVNFKNSPVVFDSVTNVVPFTFNTGDNLSVTACVSVTQWDSNVILSNSRTMQLSSVLAFGTNVTATPTALGQYRTLIKSAAALTSTDSVPSALPSGSNGMRIYGNVNFASAGTAGQINKWVVFVGLGRHVAVRFYRNAAFAGQASGEYSQETTLIARGIIWDYDPSTGLVVVDAIEQSSTTTTRNAGYGHTASTTAPANLADMYFDIFVSDTPLAIEASHKETHIVGGADIIDADRSQIDFVPTNYTAVATAPFTTTTGELTSHLKGIDNKLTGAVNTSVTDTVTSSTTSATFVVVTSMTITPVSGTYLVMYSASASVSANAADVDYALHLNGVVIAHSTRRHDYNGGAQTTDYRMAHHTQAVIVTPGAQAIDLRIQTSAGTISTFGRSLTIVKVA